MNVFGRLAKRDKFLEPDQLFFIYLGYHMIT
jgi:hypothetical protein